MPTINNASAGITNPLQTNNTLATAVGYLAGLAAAKLPWFDFATWNYIIMSVGGAVFVAIPAILNRKTAVVATVANMPEVTKIELDKTVPGATALAQATPNEVVAK
jgi:hypothetical protein